MVKNRLFQGAYGGVRYWLFSSERAGLSQTQDADYTGTSTTAASIV